MTVKIDEFGRLLLPPSIRVEMGLREGDSVEVIRTPTGVELRPSSPEPASRLVADGPLLVFHADQIPADFDLRRFMDERRQTHDGRNAGLTDEDPD